MPVPQIPAPFLTTLLDALEAGYGKYRNPYHNQVHAADVTQTVHCFLLRTGMLVWGHGGCPPGSHGAQCRPSAALVLLVQAMLVATETAPPGDCAVAMETVPG